MFGLASLLIILISIHVLFDALGRVMWRKSMWKPRLGEIKWLAENKPASKLPRSVLLNYWSTASHSGLWRDGWQIWECRQDQGRGRPYSWLLSHVGDRQGSQGKERVSFQIQRSCCWMETVLWEFSDPGVSDSGHKHRTHTARKSLLGLELAVLAQKVKNTDYPSGGQPCPHLTLCQVGLQYRWWESKQVLSNWEEFRNLFTGLSFLLLLPSFFF